MDRHTLFLDSPADCWELASPVGNGYSGAMIYGGAAVERIQLSEESIWSGAKIDGYDPGFYEKLGRVRELLLAGKAPEADEYAEEALKSSFHRIKSQETAGELFFDFGGGADYTEYRRELDLLHGISTVSFLRNGVKQVRETFASYPDRVIAARHTGEHSVRVRYDRRAASAKADWKTHRTETLESGELVGVRSRTIEGDTLTIWAAPAEGGKEFCVKLRVRTDGTLTSDGYDFVISGATVTEYYIAIGVGYEPILPDMDYDALRARSAEDFASLMGRSDINFGEDRLSGLSVDRRIERLRADPDAVDAGLAALYFRFGKYLLVGSSRRGSLPANLQGVWNGYTEAPWNNDYHTNINLQMNYWHAETANLSECAEPLFEYMNKYLLESGRETACNYYHCRGTVLHHLSDIYGFTAPADGLWGLWPLGGAWLCYSMWEHYLFTGDIQFLRETAYDYIHDCARFFLDYMFEDGEGRLLSGPSTSPENRYYCNGKPSYLCLSPSMDIEIIGGLLRFYIKAEELLKLDPDQAGEAERALRKMPPLRVGKHGQLMEWLEDYDEPEPGHRHVSHMFALYPDCAISPDTPELFAAAKRTLERRLANGGGHTGWSCAWLIALYARLGDREGVSAAIRKLFVNSTLGNLLDTHPPFQIDGNFGATAALAEMLLQSHNGRIRILPACPDEYAAEGGFVRLCARGGVEVSANWKNGAVTGCTITAIRKAWSGVLELNGQEYMISLEKGESITV